MRRRDTVDAKVEELHLAAGAVGAVSPKKKVPEWWRKRVGSKVERFTLEDRKRAVARVPASPAWALLKVPYAFESSMIDEIPELRCCDSGKVEASQLQ